MRLEQLCGFAVSFRCVGLGSNARVLSVSVRLDATQENPDSALATLWQAKKGGTLSKQRTRLNLSVPWCVCVFGGVGGGGGGMWLCVVLGEGRGGRGGQ